MLTNTCGSTVTATPGVPSRSRTNNPRHRIVQVKCNGGKRDVSAQAGRSKKKPGGPSPGRIEGSGEERRMYKDRMDREYRNRDRWRGPKSNAPPLIRRPWDKSPFFMKLVGDLNDEVDDRDLTERERWFLGASYERAVRFMDGPDDPNLRDPMDWYKYGPNSPYKKLGIGVGKPRRGRIYDRRVTMFSTVKDTKHMELININNAACDYDHAVHAFMDRGSHAKFFWTFVRRLKGRDYTADIAPWDDWSLVAQIAVEVRSARDEDIDKFMLGPLIGNRSMRIVGRCVSWFRPDLVFVKKPVFQVRFEPQEEFFRCLTEFVDPLTEMQWEFEAGGVRGSFYEGLCRCLGVGIDASDQEAVEAFEKLDKAKKSACLGYVFSNHPVNILHPFTKSWKRRYQRERRGVPYEEEIVVGDDEEEENLVEEETVDEEEERVEKEKVEKNVDEESEFESFAKEAEFWEREIGKLTGNGVEPEFVEDNETGVMREAMKAMDAREEERGDGETEVGADEKTTDIVLSDFVHSAVRPFTYKNLIREIVLLRKELLEYRIESREPILFM